MACTQAQASVAWLPDRPCRGAPSGPPPALPRPAAAPRLRLRGALSLPLHTRPPPTSHYTQGALEGGFAGRTAKLVDGCYSFWQGGAFPILADLLRQQQVGRPAGAAAQSAATGLRAAAAAGAAGGRGSAGAAPDAAVAARLSKLLLGEAPEGSDGDASPRAGDPAREPSLAEWVGDLPKLTPLAAVQRRQIQLQTQLDAAVEASLEAEERYQAAAGQAAGGPLQQEALAALDRAADLQKVGGVC